MFAPPLRPTCPLLTTASSGIEPSEPGVNPGNFPACHLGMRGKKKANNKTQRSVTEALCTGEVKLVADCPLGWALKLWKYWHVLV